MIKKILIYAIVIFMLIIGFFCDDWESPLLVSSDVKTWSFINVTKASMPMVMVISGRQTGKYGDEIEFYLYKPEGGLEKKYTYHVGDFKPWEIKVCDINGDGRKEIGITMYKETNFQEFLADRPYIFYWKEKGLVPMWRGSSFSRLFEKYEYANLDDLQGDEVVTVERLREGDYIIHVYGWRGFGFESIGQSKSFQMIKDLEAKGDDIFVTDGKNNLFKLILDEDSSVLLKHIQ